MTERERQYHEMNLYGKCTTIAEELGESYHKKHGVCWIYKDDELYIEYDDYGKNLWVKWRGQSVLVVHLGELELFRPGSWIREINGLADKAGKIADMRKRIQKFKNILEQMKNWEEV